MTGVWIERKKKGLSAEKLAALAGVAPSSIRKWEREIPPNISTRILVALADALEVQVDDLMKTYDDVLPPNNDRVPYNCKYPPENCIEVYRRDKRLSYSQLAEHMGVSSRQGASQACRAKRPGMKYLTRLAALEGISPDAFMAVYAVEKGAD